MTTSIRALLAPVVIVTALLSLAACTQGEEAVTADGEVEMRDMEVIDGTVNDDMTNLDAVRADGTGLASGEASSVSDLQDAGLTAEEDANAEEVAAE